MTTIQIPIEKTLDMKRPAGLLPRTRKSDRRSMSPHVYITVGFCYASMHTYARAMHTNMHNKEGHGSDGF